MRVTQRSIALTSLQGLNRNQEAVAKLQQQLTSGRSISKPSDDPTGTNAAMQTRQEIAGAKQYARNISDGMSQLDATDSALQSMVTQLHRVRALTLQGANAGAMSDASRAAISTEVAGIRDSLLALANTTVQGQPIFGGVTSGPTAYDPTTGTYQGVGGAAGASFPVTRQVSDTDSVRIDVTGPEAFGESTSTSRDLFQLVGDIADHAVSDPGSLAGDLDGLDEALDRLLGAASDIGTRTNRMETAQQVNSDLQLTLTSRSADIENVDLAKTIMYLNMQQTSYEAALSATAKVIQPTLADFLR